ncbi:MAG: hypothetical protein KJN64_15580 [Ignavibacteria bacterium]|nr:hypothetical protein [Ignavibacteria bacterium]MBT8382451.1 hypothetical protein [Ignavibacteria bacterium]MBT8392828.1 hypothetical protein [Ignavibacteria bacterium]NNJ53606.1 hypothetical protein [Ignavibacteriaceae bacterium]NNL20213.1 hypothetical protein [Ignavibacteriaceae bacterium]
MRTVFHIFIISTTFLSLGCESEELLSPEAVHTEYTVVQAEIHPDKLFPGVRFTKTLPLGVPYNIQHAELKLVTAYLVKNEVQIIPLHYTTEGIYKPRYEFYVEEGETYELIAERDNIYIYSKTVIPYKPSVTNTNYNAGSFYFDADVSSKLNEVYGALWIISRIPPARAIDFFSITQPASIVNTSVGIRTSSLPEKYRGPVYSDSRYIQVYAFDVSFRKYFYSRKSGQEINDPFIQGGGAVEWNVQGDKVIGMFIGITAGDIIKID